MPSLLTLALYCSTALAIGSFVIPGWDLQSTDKASHDLATISSPTYDSTSWYHISCRKTVFAGLVEAGVYDDNQLFYSKNLQETVDYLPYYSPWLYRSEFKLHFAEGSHYFLQTNGTTSKADIYLNGQLVADKKTQAGAYGGHIYDITKIANSDNALVLQAYPTSYDEDFGLGFVDWNPYPPDNGTGVWRDVSVKQTGPFLMGSLRVINNYTPGAADVEISLKAEVTNLESSNISGTMQGILEEVKGFPNFSTNGLKQIFTLEPFETRLVTLSTRLSSPKVWWPKQWGDQPLYTAQATITVHNAVSDKSAETIFGIRHITSEVNEHNDTIFRINGHPFQVRGSGYAPDLFLRWDESRFEAIAQYVLDMGMNTIRLEGKEEHPELYTIADRIGLMVMPGWECCDKWEAWTYNDKVTATLWNNNDYDTANASIRHEAAMLQSHPSILAFLVGSDFWPDDRAAAIYIDALHDLNWQNPIICSAAKRGYPEILGPSGMKMPGPYDWVPPNYWYGRRFGAAFGFGSELGAGVGTPEIGSLKEFLSESDMEDLWTNPNKDLYHMSTNVSKFHNRKIYNKGLYSRYEAPTSLNDYLLMAQMMFYEATRAEHEAYQARWNDDHPATGLVYWMLNNAGPSLHWNQFDYYLHPAGSYFGTKVGSRIEHVAYDYEEESVYLINHSLDKTGSRLVHLELIDLDGTSLSKKTVSAQTVPNTSKSIATVPGLNRIQTVVFLRLLLCDTQGDTLSRNVYWLRTSLDELHWNKSSWFSTPVSPYADLTALNTMEIALVSVSAHKDTVGDIRVKVKNEGPVPAFFIRLNLIDGEGNDVVPVLWSDNYITLWPHERWSSMSNSRETPVERPLK